MCSRYEKYFTRKFLILKRRNQCYFQHAKCYSTINFIIMTLKINYNKQTIERGQQFRLLGVVIDEQFELYTHVRNSFKNH